MDLGIAGKSALVFGASRGIGQGIAQALAAEGVNVFLVARNAEALASNAAQLSREFGVRVEWLAMDVYAQPVAHLLAQLTQQNWDIDILVNISGGPQIGSASDSGAEQYQTQFQGMVGFFIEISRQLAQPMATRKWGRILTVGSSGVCQPIKDLAISNTLRSALIAWNKTFSDEVAASGITINTLLPGRIQTERVNEIDQARAARTGVSQAQIVAQSTATIPARRYGCVTEFSATAAFLCSQGAAYITGSCIRVDGGLIRSTY
ncbi:SDR family oxidoreductase [Pseudoalteromonas viridis]|uniref:SDR family oxidoreductase n=1 Tax=Pseudoalteromonas viridis TaxID=339617 RepID=A0ABX7V7I4_9GAMM|nr:SDR family oxidoreductase [Pseudoalteromonas viridis]QTL36853.1 SDR family oxidoreductase [Pseudoalteromonas viridis]